MRKAGQLARLFAVRVRQVLTEERGISTVELILILVVKSTPYHGVGIRCIA